MSIAWRSAFRVIPVPVFYVAHLPDGRGGEARGPIVRILDKYRGDAGIHAHELEHVRQFWLPVLIALAWCALAWLVYSVAPEFWPRWRGVWLFEHWPLHHWAAPVISVGALLHPLAYRFSRAYRLGAEVSAYREQIGTAPYRLSFRRAAEFIAARYDLRISVSEAEVALLKV